MYIHMCMYMCTYIFIYIYIYTYMYRTVQLPRHEWPRGLSITGWSVGLTVLHVPHSLDSALCCETGLEQPHSIPSSCPRQEGVRCGGGGGAAWFRISDFGFLVEFVSGPLYHLGFWGQLVAVPVAGEGTKL